MFSESSSRYLVTDSCRIHLAGPIHLHAILTPALQASMLTTQLEHLYQECQENRCQIVSKPQNSIPCGFSRLPGAEQTYGALPLCFP